MSIRTVIDFSPLLETTIPCRVLAATASFSATGVPVPAVLPCFGSSPFFPPRAQPSACAPAARLASSLLRSKRGAGFMRLARALQSAPLLPGKIVLRIGSALRQLRRQRAPSRSSASALGLGAPLHAGGVGRAPRRSLRGRASSATDPRASDASSWGVSSVTSFFSSSLISSALSRRRSPLLGHRQQLGDVPPGAAQPGRVLQLAGRLAEAQVERLLLGVDQLRRSARRL